MTPDDATAIGRLDAHGQAALLRSGELSALDLVEAAIQRIVAIDPMLGALSAEGFDQARARAAGPLPDRPLAGVPYLLKCSLDYPGLPSLAGSRSRGHAPAARSYPLTDAYDAEGLIVLGKTAMPEFGLLPTTEPVSAPPTRNPWSLSHSPGGSSGGAGAALAAGLVALAHGSDGAGSIRIPASCCGVVGLKPGRGATVRARARNAIEDMIVGDGLMSRSVRDTAWGFAAARSSSSPMVSGPSPHRLRIALSLDTIDGAAPDPQVVEAVQHVAALCQALGHTVDIAGPRFDRPAAAAAIRTLWAHDGADCVDAVRASGRDVDTVLEPWTVALGEMADALPVHALEKAYGQIGALPALLASFYDDYDVLLTPTLTAPPPLIGDIAPTRNPEALMARMFGWLGYTTLQNLSGSPAISLPLAWSTDGLPIGVMLAADRGGEDLLLALAYELEAAQPWAQRWPDLNPKDD